jgi:formylglycine-generating enzyme required for sulfatase activity
VLLAGQAIDEGISLAMVEEEEAERVARVRWALVQVVQGRTLPAVERALAGRKLAHLGDPRPAVMTVEQMEFCAIPAGPFAAGKAEKKARKNGQAGELPYPYWMSRYPVTHAQYSLFVAAQGYSKEGYWLEAQKEGYWSKAGFKGRYDGVVRTAPYAYREPFSLANHPVVGVTWYEAVAFCRWFSEQMTIPSWRVRLPSKAEWAKAAVGGLETPATPLRVAWAEQGWGQAMPALTPNGQPQRRYPWGDEFSPELANGQETSIGATSAVGCFGAGASPYGVEELSGNVWEWLDEDYDKYSKVIRGETYYTSLEEVTSAARQWYNPNYRDDDVGFRCVVVPISR